MGPGLVLLWVLGREGAASGLGVPGSRAALNTAAAPVPAPPLPSSGTMGSFLWGNLRPPGPSFPPTGSHFPCFLSISVLWLLPCCWPGPGSPEPPFSGHSLLPSLPCLVAASWGSCLGLSVRPCVLQLLSLVLCPPWGQLSPVQLPHWTAPSPETSPQSLVPCRGEPWVVPSPGRIPECRITGSLDAAC